MCVGLYYYDHLIGRKYSISLSNLICLVIEYLIKFKTCGRGVKKIVVFDDIQQLMKRVSIRLESH